MELGTWILDTSLHKSYLEEYHPQVCLMRTLAARRPSTPPHSLRICACLLIRVQHYLLPPYF